MEPTNILPIAAVLSLVTVEHGGWALLSFISGREDLADWQKGLLPGRVRPRGRAAGALAHLPALPAPRRLLRRARVGGRRRAAHGRLAQSEGFFLHLGVGEQGKPSASTKLTRAGAALIAAALVTLAIGLIQTAYGGLKRGSARRTVVGGRDSLGLEVAPSSTTGRPSEGERQTSPRLPGRRPAEPRARRRHLLTPAP
jgi:hypothetical protein